MQRYEVMIIGTAAPGRENSAQTFLAYTGGAPAYRARCDQLAAAS